MVIHLARDCEKLALSEKQPITDFDCGNADLNEFFNQEKEAYRQTPDETLRTRYMFYDMIQWRNRMNS